MKKLYFLLAICLSSAMNVRADEVTVYDGTQKNQWAPFALAYCNGWTESQYVIPESALDELYDKTITGVKYYCDATSDFTSNTSINFYMWEAPNTVTSLSGFKSVGSMKVGYSGQIDFVMNDGVCEATITFNEPLLYVGGSLIFYAYNSSPQGYDNVWFYGQTVDGACWAGNNDEMGGVMANVAQRNFAPKTTFICEDEPEPDTREVITSVELEGFDYSSAYIGATWSISKNMAIAADMHPVDVNAPYYIADGGSLYETITYSPVVNDAVLSEGTYYFVIQLRIDGEYGLLYRFPTREEGVPTVIVDGEQWEVLTDGYGYSVRDKFCFIYARSHDFEIAAQGIENTNDQMRKCESAKIIRDAQLLILRGGHTYTLTGQEIIVP